MKKSEMLEEALQDVCYITELKREQVMSKCRKTHYVDARYMLVYLLAKKNLYTEEIAELMGCTAVNIRKIIDNMDARAKGYGMFRDRLEQLENYLANK